MSSGNLSYSGRRQVRLSGPSLAAVLLLAIVGLSVIWTVYTSFRIDVGSGEMAVLIRKTGLDITNGDEIAPTPDHKGIQREVLAEGRHFYNPYTWSWQVDKQIEIAPGDMGIKISLTGDDLGYGDFLARVNEKGEATTKGIMPGVLNPGRYPINPSLLVSKVSSPIWQPHWLKTRTSYW